MEPKIVEAVGTIIISTDKIRKTAKEAAAVKAILACIDEGITDPEIIKARKLLAIASV